MTTYQSSFEPLSHIGISKPNDTRKASHTVSSTSPSPTDSTGSQPTKRKRPVSPDLDYTLEQLSAMRYQSLASESFDHTPPSSLPSNKNVKQNSPTPPLPSPTIPLPTRLNTVYSADTSNRTQLARTFFASLTIEQYEECGDLLLSRFGDVMGRLKQARREKRRVAREMEEKVAGREEWVRRKRDGLEAEMGRLKGAGMGVVKPERSRSTQMIRG